ncbi:MAG: hypothetical protein FJ009_12685 [Chloroflexi bacterium]|nr:hypothetical protein [Chloroflexota bacterium]
MNIILDGQIITLPDDVAQDDQLIRRALAPFYPAVTNAQIKREEKDGETQITVIKRAEPLG